MRFDSALKAYNMQVNNMQTIEKPPMKTARAIILEPNANSVYNLPDYGEVVHLFPAGAIRPSIYDCDNFSDAISDALEKIGYDPATDYIVICGGQIQVASLAAVIGVGYGCLFKALLFDVKKRTYFEGRLG